MKIREITSKYKSGIEIDGQPLHKVWRLNVLGTILFLERYGSFCGWAQLRLVKEGVEVYRITKPFGSGTERTEFFFDRQIRNYVGDQFSFVEYITSIAEQQRIPDTQEYVRAGLDVKIEEQYKEYIQRILDTK